MSAKYDRTPWILILLLCMWQLYYAAEFRVNLWTTTQAYNETMCYNAVYGKYYSQPVVNITTEYLDCVCANFSDINVGIGRVLAK